MATTHPAPHSSHGVADYHPDGTPDLPEEHSATHHVTLGTYLFVFALLMILLVVTVLAALFVHVGDLNVVLALAIAIIKAALVVLFFMHVKYASRLTKIFVSAAFLWLIILFSFTFSDYLTRSWLPVSRGWTDKNFSVPQLPAAEPKPEHERAAH